MHNQVVVSVCELLSRRGIAALRFNFRGVGGSEGRFARGEGEKEDLRGALHFLGEEELIDAEKLGVCGYSFGSMVAVPVGAESDEVKAIAAISPVVSLSPLRNCGKPKFFIWGERDAFINSSFLKREIEELPEPCDFKIIPPADHFWIGFERVVGEEVAEFFSRVLKSPGRSIIKESGGDRNDALSYLRAARLQ